jgi:Carboxypeptidase regulatory-like domain
MPVKFLKRGFRTLVQYGVLALFAVATMLYGQNSQVSGRVLDPSQAGVTAAAVVLTQADTGDRREAATNAEGYYTFPLLLPGVYDLTVQKDGFESQTRKGIKVETGQISAVDVTLAVGEVSQSVSVDASLPLLQTDSAAVSNVVENATIVDMPLIDRRSTQLTRLNGFIVQIGGGSSTSFAVAGGRGGNANFYIDGGSVENVSMGTPTLYFDPPVDAMQEFNVAVSNYAAELGRTGGGVFQMTTKSGTNEFHGSAYEFFRNDVLNANTFFAKSKPILRYNLFGGGIGGPIKKNKTHFFFNYEGKRQVNASTVNLVIPTPAELSGNFNGSGIVVKNPSTGLPFANNTIPGSLLDPVGVNLGKFYPAPNISGGSTNFLANDPVTTVVDNYVARIDHTFNDNNRLFVRFLGQPDTTTTGAVFPVAAADPYGYLVHDYYYNGNGTWTRNFSPTLINELSLTLSRRQTLSISPGANTDISQQIGLMGANQAYFPSVALSGFTGLGTTQGNGQERLQTPVEAHALVDSLTKIKGSHQIKIGGEYRYGKDGEVFNLTAGGSLSFNNQATGSSVASLLLGWVNQGSVLQAYPLHSRLDTYGFYIQDDWKVARNLTLNLGLRYDVDTPRWEINNRQNSFNTTEINPVSGTPGVITFAGLYGQSKYAHNWDLNNFGPRIGFAWKPRDKWVVRGGGAILYTGEYDIAAPVVLYTGFSTQGTFVSSNNGATPAFLLKNGFPVLSSPTPAQLTPGYGAVPVGQTPTTSPTFFQPDRQTGFLYQTSFDIQRELGRSTMLDIGYVGSFGHHLTATVSQSINQVPTSELGPGNLQSLRPFPQFSNVQILGADLGRSDYNALNIGVDRRLSSGLQFKVNYTYSVFLDNLNARSEVGNVPAFTNFYNQANDWGLSANDLRHRLVVSTIYELPVGKGKLYSPSNRFVDGLIGGWSLGAIIETHTGPPLGITELTNNTNSYSDGVRPNVVGNPSLSGNPTRAQQLAEWFNTAAFAAPAPYTFGNAGKTFGVAPGLFSLDASLLKDFTWERYTLQFRVEALNFTNHANFAPPNTQQGSATFGEVTSLVAGNQARIIQLGLHLKF